jgi:hypothetical protein
VLHEQAKVAIERKNLTTAATIYENAVALAPWWADGHFNAALILGELDAVDAASAEMRRYSFLKPDAPDTAVVQAKLAEWTTPAFPVETISTSSVPAEPDVPVHVGLGYTYHTAWGQGARLDVSIPLPLLATKWSHAFLELGYTGLYHGAPAPPGHDYWRWSNIVPIAAAYELGVFSRTSLVGRIGIAPYLTSPPGPSDTTPLQKGAAGYAGGSLTFGGASRITASAEVYFTGLHATVLSVGFRL